MQTSIVIILLGLFIFYGRYLSGLFERRSIPDVIGLMLIGILMGPVFHWVDPISFGKFGSLFGNLVLIFILFESGTDLRIAEVKSSFRESAGITTLNFFVTCIVLTILCVVVFDLSILSSLFVGATLGGTSSAVVTGLIKKVAVTPKTSTTLIMESAESDVFTLAIPLVILGLMLTGQMEPRVVISNFISSLVIALVIGIGGAFIWSVIVNKFPTLKATSFATPAFLFILYGITESLNFSGPLTALSFGIAIGNLEYLEPKILEKIVPNQSIVLPQAEKVFFSQIVFLLRIFFFIFIGLSIQISRWDWLLWGAFMTAILYVLRIVVVQIIASKQTPLLDKSMMAIMIPKGLGAAVIATLPLQEMHADGIIIQAICFSVILFSTFYCTALFFLIKTGKTLGFYSKFFRT
ncbi:MAG: cation:proton antiporter [Bacteroidota bacterium]|nr:cation:proton antiporter [Bacteroidota bacterium]